MKKEEKKDKLVSFVIPIFETENYLEKCLQSLLSQDHKNIEIICVADGKNDKAQKIFDKLHQKDSRLVRYETIQHGGAPKARNEGYKYTTGDYVSFWDSDTYAEPGMVRMWVRMFKDYPDVSFVYSDYRFSNGQCLISEPFNKYLLTCRNYIATMFPMKREVFPGFDENLKSLQDWDMWLTLVEKGHKGVYLQGSAFTTEIRENGISAIGCSNANYLDRFNTVRDKHGIKDRDICFTSPMHKERALELAELFKQDYSDNPSYFPHKYKTIWVIGCYPQTMDSTMDSFARCEGECKKVIHWTGIDVENFFNIPYRMVKTLVEILNKKVNKHYVEYESGRKMLEEVGIKADILLIPTNYKDIPLPKEFKVYYDYDKTTFELLDSIKKACPDIKLESPEGYADLSQYAGYLSISRCSVPADSLKRFISSGRFIITNYRLPYAGFVPVDGNMAKSKRDIISKLRHYQRCFKKNNFDEIKKGQEYWKQLIEPTKMQGVINEIIN